MKWRGVRGSRNVEDRRRMSRGKTGGVGIVGLLVILAIGAFFDVDVSSLLNAGGGSTVSSTTARLTKEDETQRQKWFARGYKSGRMDQYNTFAALN